MIGRLNHIAIAVPSIQDAAHFYEKALGAKVSAPKEQPDHGVTTVFVTLPNTKIELLEPLGTSSPIASFLQKNPRGGMHHLCLEVENIHAAKDQAERMGLRVLGDGTIKKGAHDKPVLFLHPSDCFGTLIEFEEV